MAFFRPFARGLYNYGNRSNEQGTSGTSAYSSLGSYYGNNAYDSRELDAYVNSNLKQRKSESFNFWAAAGGMTMAGAVGFIPTKSGEPIWSHYVRGLQHIEGLSPFHVFRTFRASEFLSPLGAPSYLKYSPSKYSHLLSSPKFQDYISKITGLSSSRLDELGVFQEGFEFRRTGTSVLGSLYSRGGELIKRDVGLLSTGFGPSSGFTAEWFARIAGARNPKGFLTPTVAGEALRAPGFVPISAPGGQKQLAAQYGHAIFSAGVGRLNLLIQSPFQTDLFKNLAKKAPFLNKLVPNIKQGTALQMLGRYTALAGKAGLAIHGVKYLDYLQRQDSSILALPRNAVAGGLIGGALTKSWKGAGIGAAALGVAGMLPAFGEEGYIGGVLDIYANLRVDLAKLSAPWRAGAKRAEDNFKGITEVKTLVGFAGTGLLLGGAYEYFDRLRTVAKTYKATKASGNLLYEVAEEVTKQRRENIAAKFAKVAEGLSGRDKFVAETLGKWKSSAAYKKGLVAGAGAFGVLSTIGSVVSGDLLGAATTAAGFGGAAYAWAKGRPAVAGLAMLATFALRGKESAEELKQIYSGEKLVESRRGRWWEAGRCNTYTSHIYTNVSSYKEAQDITLEDTLLGADGKPHAIKNIYTRRHSGKVVYITTNLDRNVKTGLTLNHILPVLKEKNDYGEHIKKTNRKVEFLSAEEVEPGDYVQIPVPVLPEIENSKISLEKILEKHNLLSDDDFIYPTQTNWFTGKRQRSSGKRLPKETEASEELGRLIGYFLAEGNISFRDKDIPQFIETAHSMSEFGNVEDIRYICKNLFDIDITVRKKIDKKKGKDGCWIVRICSSLLAKVFFELFYSSKRENDKKMPGLVYELGDKNFRASIIKGYWRGDGHEDRGRCVISSSRKHLIDDLLILLLNQKKYPTVPKVEFTNHTKKDGEVCLKYRIGWREEDFWLLESCQSFLLTEQGLFVRVCSVEYEEYDNIVYDFEIDHEDHLIKNGTFLVHNSPWQGKRPYYRKHRIALYKEHTREEALYGGESEYWNSDPIISPIKFLLDPYAREKLMYEQGWRFPVTQTPFEDFPILGPVLAATIGQLIKPTKYINRDQWMDPEGAGPAPPGYGNIAPEKPVLGTSIGSTFGEMFYRTTEITGLPGFTAQSILEAVTGEETPFIRPRYMTPSDVAGIEPAYWGLNLGGGAGLTELIRRFIPHHRREQERVNPMPSGLPSWLPQGSENEYFLDFGRADIYTKFDEAWARLPGPGLAAAKFPELKGIDPSDWPAYYRYLTLADIAPWSREYTRYSSFMSQMADSGELTPEQLMTVQETRKQVAEVKRRKDFDRYKYDMDQVRRQTVHITGQVDTGLYLTKEFGTAPVQLAGLNTSVAALARIAKTQAPDISGTEAFRRAEKKKIQIDEYIQSQIQNGQLEIYAHKDPSMLMKRTAVGPIVPAVLIGKAGQNINRQLETLGLAEQDEQDESVLANMAGVNFAQRAFGSFWENLLHGMETPLEVFTPVAPTAKFIHQRTPLEDYLRSRIYAREVAMWDKPVSHFIAPGLRTVAWWAGWRGLPQDVRERYMIEEYFDRLEHEKQKRLQSAAIAAGQGDKAAEHASHAARTLTGANPFSPHQVYMALPKAERDYFKAFVEAPTREERREIARYVSPQMRTALEAQWLRKEMEAAQMRQEAGVGTAEDKAIIRQFWNKRAAIARRRTKMPQKNYPPADWTGWRTETQMRDYKLRTVMDQGLDIHDFSFWQSDVREVERRPYVQPVSAAFAPEQSIDLTDTLMSWRESLQMQGEQGYDSYTTTADGTNNIEITSPGHNRLARFLRDPTISTFGF